MDQSNLSFLASCFHDRQWVHRHVDVVGQADVLQKLSPEQLQQLIRLKLHTNPGLTKLEVREIRDGQPVVHLEEDAVVDLQGKQPLYDWTVRPVTLGDKSVQVAVKRRSWKQLWHRMAKRWGKDAPVSGFLVKYLILPIVATGKYLFARKSKRARAAEHVEKLLTAVRPSNSQEFRRLLRQQIRLLESVEPPPERELERLRETLDLAKKAARAQEEGTVRTFADETARAIRSLGHGEELSLAAGFYDDEGVYTPALYCFHRVGDETLMLHRFEFGADGESRSWNLADTGERSLSALLSRFLSERAEATSATEEEAKQQLVYREALPRVDQAVRRQEMAPALLHYLKGLPPDLRKKLLAAYQQQADDRGPNDPDAENVQQAISFLKNFPRSEKQLKRLAEKLARQIEEGELPLRLPGGYLDESDSVQAGLFTLEKDPESDALRCAHAPLNNLADRSELAEQNPLAEVMDLYARQALHGKADSRFRRQHLELLVMSHDAGSLRNGLRVLAKLREEARETPTFDDMDYVYQQLGRLHEVGLQATEDALRAAVNRVAKAIEALKDGGSFRVPTMHQDAAGAFHVIIYTYSKESGALHLSRREMNLEDASLGAEALLSSDMVAPSRSLDAQQRIGLKDILKLRSGAAQAPTLTKKSEDDSEQRISARERILNAIEFYGGKGQPIARRAKNGFDLMHAWLHSDSLRDDNALMDRMQFGMLMIEAQLQTVAQAARKLDPKLRAEVGEELLGRLQQLRNQVTYAFGSDEVFSILFSREDALFGNLEARVRELIGGESTQRPHQAEVTLLSAEQRTAIQSERPEQGAPVIEATVHEVVTQDIRQFKQAIQDKGYADALRLYTGLVDRLDTLVTEGDYQDAVQLAARLQQLPPIPEADNEDQFWDGITYRTLGDAAWTQLSDWSSQIERLSRCQWEACLRLHRTHLEPSELLGLMQGRAVLVKLERMKVRWVSRKARNLRIPSPQGMMGSRRDATHWSPELSQKWRDTFTLEQTATWVFEHYQTDTRQFTDILQFHPYYRLEAYPHLKERADGLLAYLDGVGDSAGKRRAHMPVIRLDAWVSAPADTADSLGWDAENRSQQYDRSNDTIYLYDLQQLARAYGKEMSFEDIWKEVSMERSGTLPMGMRCLQRHNAYFQQLYRPEFALALQFGSNSASAGMKAYAWWNRIQKQSIEETQDAPERQAARAQELAYQDLARQLDSTSMSGRLNLSSEDYFVTGDPVLTVTASAGRGKLFYLPWGLGFPDMMKQSFNPGPRDEMTADLAGGSPSGWTGVIGAQDAASVRPSGVSQEDYHRLTREAQSDTVQARRVLTEATLMKLCLDADSALGPVDEYLLRSLTVTGGNDDRLNAGASSLLEGLQMVLARPDLLSHPSVRHKLDLILTEPGLVETLVQRSPGTLEAMGTQLQHLIHEQFQHKSVPEAAFLTHVGELIASRCDVNTLPRYNTEYQIEGVSRSASALLLERRTAAPEQAAWAELEATMLHWEERKGELDAEERARILQAAQDLESAGARIGTPFINTILLHWVRDVFLPELLQGDVSACMEHLVPANERDPDVAWQQHEQSRFVYERGSLQIDLRSMQLRKDGVLMSSPPVTVEVPEDLRTRLPELAKLLPSGTEVQRSRSGPAGLYHYNFESDGVQYRVSQDTATGVASLSRLHDGAWFRLTKPQLPEDSAYGLLADQGIWVQEDNLEKGLLLLPSAPAAYQQIAVSLDAEGKLVSLQAAGQRLSVASEALVAERFPFMKADFVLCDADDENHYIFVDKKLEIRNGSVVEDGRALGSVVSEGDASIHAGDKRAERLAELLGCDVTLRLRDGEVNSLLIWPHAVQRSLSGLPLTLPPKTLQAAIAQPLVPIEIARDGSMQCSAAGYLYMGYVLGPAQALWHGEVHARSGRPQ